MTFRENLHHNDPWVCARFGCRACLAAITVCYFNDPYNGTCDGCPNVDGCVRKVKTW